MSKVAFIGLGVMGLHDVLLLHGLKYNSAAGLELADKIMRFIKNAAYEASIALAQEKGAFPKFDKDKEPIKPEPPVTNTVSAIQPSPPRL